MTNELFSALTELLPFTIIWRVVGTTIGDCLLLEKQTDFDLINLILFWAAV